MADSPLDHQSPVAIVGAGLSGLTCAKVLTEHGVACRVFEASDGVGGRVRTDMVEGFRLDRGFQVFLTSYPEAAAQLDYHELQLGEFEPGALIRYGGKFRTFSDPFRRPGRTIATALSPVATVADKLRIARLRGVVSRGPFERFHTTPERSTDEFLREFGFSDRVLNGFFKPFLGGVFLEPELGTSSRVFEFVFRMFGSGRATLPAAGMEAIPRQLAAHLPSDAIELNARVSAVDCAGVVVGGEQITASAVVVATDFESAGRLGQPDADRHWRSVTCHYFAAETPPIREPILVLDADGGPISSLCVPSLVAPTYAPEGQCLVSVSVLGTDRGGASDLESVREQLRGWFGEAADGLRHLRTYQVEQALPDQLPGRLEPVEKPVRTADEVFRCGDHLDTASIQGAMASGRRAAEAVLAARAN